MRFPRPTAIVLALASAATLNMGLPVDYANPDGAKIALRLGRAPALDPAKRKGVLLLLPGGPGAGIMEIIGGEMRTAQHLPEFQQQYRRRRLRPGALHY
jgi:hypothetical protein